MTVLHLNLERNNRVVILKIVNLKLNLNLGFITKFLLYDIL